MVAVGSPRDTSSPAVGSYLPQVHTCIPAICMSARSIRTLPSTPTFTRDCASHAGTISLRFGFFSISCNKLSSSALRRRLSFSGSSWMSYALLGTRSLWSSPRSGASWRFKYESGCAAWCPSSPEGTVLPSRGLMRASARRTGAGESAAVTRAGCASSSPPSSCTQPSTSILRLFDSMAAATGLDAFGCALVAADAALAFSVASSSCTPLPASRASSAMARSLVTRPDPGGGIPSPSSSPASIVRPVSVTPRQQCTETGPPNRSEASMGSQMAPSCTAERPASVSAVNRKTTGACSAQTSIGDAAFSAFRLMAASWSLVDPDRPTGRLLIRDRDSATARRDMLPLLSMAGSMISPATTTSFFPANAMRNSPWRSATSSMVTYVRCSAAGDALLESRMTIPFTHCGDIHENDADSMETSSPGPRRAFATLQMAFRPG
mmetsp:Transcript_7704/g.19585  ORF Transcript_7704/g.19585 Transcript_7704/m.19585 type:complete len:436 (-) Transcript_7704:91-1398(-)